MGTFERRHARSHYIRAVDTNLHAGSSCAEALRFARPEGCTAADLHQGVHPLDGLPTKHYLREEIEWLLHTHEFDLHEMKKLAYPLRAPESDVPPETTSLPAPWDWLVTARRR